MNVSAGRGNGFSADPYEEPVVFVMISPFRPESILDEKKGVILQTRRNTPEGPRRLKSHHYMNNLLAKREVGNDLALEGIFLTKEDDVAEGITSNVFWRKDDVVYTPSLDTGILNGVTRRYCMETLHAMGISLKEGRYPVSHLLSADEVWMTNSVQGVVPFGSIGDIHLPKNSRTISTKLRMQYTKERQDHKE